MMDLNSLTAIAAVDGRYAEKTADLRPIFSEYALMRYRYQVEISWLIALTSEESIIGLPPLSSKACAQLEELGASFDLARAEAIKNIEKSTNHDMKAVEYQIKQDMSQHPELVPYSEWVHFACTSEDINNLSYALMLRDARVLFVEEMTVIRSQLRQLVELNRNQSMLARTHGQAATPTTLGKEIANVMYRIDRQMVQLCQCNILGKINGAVGNFNAHYAACPDFDWLSFSRNFVEEKLKLSYNPMTTQIEPHDFMAELLQNYSRINTILIDLCRDIWFYVSLHYLKQKVISEEVGSSTMPHKVNPIDFENAEGNFGIANALFNHLAQKLPISRLQRDLSDSTVLRSLGTIFGHEIIALKSLQKGLSKIEVNRQAIDEDLAANVEVLSEAVQTVMRRYGLKNPYEQLKNFTRGRSIDLQDMREFIAGLDELPEQVRQQLLQMTPSSYTGIAAELSDRYLNSKF